MPKTKLGSTDKSKQMATATKKAAGRSKSGKGTIRIPLAQQIRIRQKYVAGKSMRKIAKEENRNNATVAKVVKAEDMNAYLASQQLRYFSLVGKAVDVMEAALDAKDALTAHKVLKDSKVAPPQIVNLRGGLQPQAQSDQAKIIDVSPEAEEERALKLQMERLAAVVLEGHRVFGTPLPDAHLEEVKKEDE